MRAFRIAYDGVAYHGFQRQPDVGTVEGRLFRALDRLGVSDGGKPAGYSAAGRTDAGVSALSQTVAFEAPDWLTPAAMNSELPGDVRAWASADADTERFHAQYDAISREYTYYLHAPEATVEDDRARAVLDRLSGRNDFHNLTSDSGETIRTIRETRLDREGDFAVITLRAGGFLRQLARRIVSLLASVGRGERDLDFVDRVLSAERLDGPEGIAPAPPEPLVLTDVAYDLDFEIDERAAESARAIFERKRVDREARSRVAGAIEGGVGRS
ncbi:MAG: tRNA pseudouridine(38-40) synthase TruA [Halalkalicoccus sp.]